MDYLFGMSYLYCIIAGMLFSGALGGIVNYLYNEPPNKYKTYEFSYSVFFKYLLTGIVASLLVPLFLYMIYNKFLEEVKHEKMNFVVFCGICLIASILSEILIKTVSYFANKGKGIEIQNNIEAKINELKSVILRQTELDDQIVDYEKKEKYLVSNFFSENDSDMEKVLKSLAYGKYVYRSPMGVSKDSELNMEKVIFIIDELIELGYASKISLDIEQKYFITDKGREYCNSKKT